MESNCRWRGMAGRQDTGALSEGGGPETTRQEKGAHGGERWGQITRPVCPRPQG